MSNELNQETNAIIEVSLNPIGENLKSGQYVDHKKTVTNIKIPVSIGNSRIVYYNIHPDILKKLNSQVFRINSEPLIKKEYKNEIPF